MSFLIENCRILFKFRCPKTWDQLKETSNYDVRFCEVCKKNVYFCYSNDDIKRRNGECIAIERDGSEYLGEPEE